MLLVVRRSVGSGGVVVINSMLAEGVRARGPSSVADVAVGAGGCEQAVGPAFVLHLSSMSYLKCQLCWDEFARNGLKTVTGEALLHALNQMVRQQRLGVPLPVPREFMVTIRWAVNEESQSAHTADIDCRVHLSSAGEQWPVTA